VLGDAEGGGGDRGAREDEGVSPRGAATHGSIAVPELRRGVQVAEALEHRLLGHGAAGAGRELGLDGVVEVCLDLVDEPLARAPRPAQLGGVRRHGLLDPAHADSITAVTLWANRSHCVRRPASALRPRGVIA